MAPDSSVKRPKVFVSSTIRDLEDLRDALKFWLEEMGFEVQMSEHNDFERRPEANTFEACFESIGESDYYLLIIGRNRGTWYDEENRVSVTQQEYRVAYNSAMGAGKPRLVMCVRSDVETILRERRKMGLPDRASLLEDWKFTAEFLREVKRDREIPDAAPGPNWITPFANFRELVTTLRSSMRIRGPLPKVALRENLRHDLESSLRITMRKHEGGPSYNFGWLDRLRSEVTLELEDIEGLDKTIELSFEQIRDLIIYVATCLPRPESFLRTSINEAIVSGAFLDYDGAADGFVPSSLLNALYDLRAQLDAYQFRYNAVVDKIQPELSEAWGNAKRTKTGAVVSAMSLLFVYGLHDTHQNVVRLLVAILRHLYGHVDDVPVILRPISPVSVEVEKIEDHQVSGDQLHSWLEEDNPLLGLGMTDVTEEERDRLDSLEKVFRRALGDDVYEKLQEEAIDRLLTEGPDQADAEGEGGGDPKQSR